MGEVTIIFTNICGYSTLWNELPSAMEQATALYNQILKELFYQMGGFIVKTENDSMMVAFSHHQNAVKCCLMAQEGKISSLKKMNE
jgi:class 3 adenylate cyclase